MIQSTTAVVHHYARMLSEGSLSPGTETAYIIVTIFLVITSGLAAGLTLGLLSIDKLDLEVIKRSGTPQEQRLAARVEPLIRNPHLLLVSLLLLNSICMEALPIFLDRLLNPILAIAISVTAILIFGEILPQAVCKRHGMAVGARLSWFVRVIIVLAFPVAWPIGKLLDHILGHESVLFRRNELRALVSVHGDELHSSNGDTLLTTDEVQIIQGALDLASKTAELCMTPHYKVFSLSSDDVINRELLERVIAQGHSRIPIHRATDRQDIVGLILVKELVLVDETAGFTLSQCSMRDLPRMRADLPLYAALKLFRSGHSHMALLTRPVPGSPGPLDGSTGKNKRGMGHALLDQGGVGGEGGQVPEGMVRLMSKAGEGEEAVGIITIEDVLEELLQYEIIDETDKFVDNLQTVARQLQHRPRALKFLTRQREPRASQAGTPPGLNPALNGGTGATATTPTTTVTTLVEVRVDPGEPTHGTSTSAVPGGMSPRFLPAATGAAAAGDASSVPGAASGTVPPGVARGGAAPASAPGGGVEGGVTRQPSVSGPARLFKSTPAAPKPAAGDDAGK